MLSTTKARVLRLSADDNILVAGERIEKDAMTSEGVATRQRIPFGHKMAAQPIAVGEPVKKFGQIIGFASQPIAAGDWVHEHNCNVGAEHGAFERDYDFCAGIAADRFRAGGRARDVRGLPALQRQGRHAQLSGHPDQRQLLGDRRQVHGAGDHALGHARRLSDHRRRRAVRARHRLRHGPQGRRFRRAAPDAMGLHLQPQPRRRAAGRARLRGLPDRPHEGSLRHRRRRHLPDDDHPGDRRHQEDDRMGRRAHQGDAADRGARQARDDAGFRADAGAAMRRLGRLFRHHRQPGAGRGGRHAGPPGRHGDPLGDAGNLWRRASADAPRGEPRGRREADRAHQMVGGLHRAQWRRDEQQSVARQQARRADDHSREVAGRGGQGRHDAR